MTLDIKAMLEAAKENEMTHIEIMKQAVALAEFVRLVRAQAFEDAAQACTDIALAPSNCVLGVAVTCADAIRKLK